VAGWIARHSTDDFWLSVLVVGELRRGEALIRRRDQAAGEAIRSWLDGLVDDFADRILPVTIAIAQRWALLTVLGPIPVIDGLLAATAEVHELTLVTRNVGHVERTGVAYVNPFDPTARSRACSNAAFPRLGTAGPSAPFRYAHRRRQRADRIYECPRRLASLSGSGPTAC
jgi:predicted nucleic acid-binding protein